jgi:DNA-binding IclR family transcriptional regulator
MESTVLVKTFDLLEFLAGDEAGKTLAELAGQARVAKPTAHRILGTLLSLGYVERREVGVYRTTAKFKSLAGESRDSAILASADRVLTSLRKTCGETVNLAVLRGNRVVYLRVMESSYALRWASDPAKSDPFHCTALGQVLVGQLPDEEQAYLLKRRKFERPTPHTVTDPKHIRRILAKAKSDGHAVEREQSEIGGMCIAAPILLDDHPVAAISITLPMARIETSGEAKLIRLARQAADKISQVLKQRQSTGAI